MQTILLTGAGGGIGSATKVALEAAGARVIGIDRRDADLSSYEDIEKLEKKIAGEGVLLDWIIFAHGFIDAEGTVEKELPEDIAATLQLNITAIAYFAKLFLVHLKPGGGMVALSSTAALTANGHHAVYSASKGAVNVFMQALARNRPELSFFSVCPGPTNTPMREKIANDAKTSQPPSTVANLIAQLVSGTGGYKSGDIIVVRDGAVSVAGGVSS